MAITPTVIKGERREEFGKGAIEGVAGPEAANNASAAGTLVPMLSLGNAFDDAEVEEEAAEAESAPVNA